MQTITTVFFLSFFIIGLVGCGNNENLERVSYPNIDKLNLECKGIAKSYFRLYNTEISNFYRITDSLSFDYNHNGLNDKVVVIRPLSLLLAQGKCFEYADIDKSILLVYRNKNNKLQLANKFDNLFCSKDPTILNQKLENYSDGFKVIGDYGMGNGRKVYYNIYVNSFNNEFVIDSITYDESMTNNPFSKTYDYTKKKLLLNDYQRNFICDSL